jgi:nucleoside-diphosphate-sugar epimerase
MTILVTGATGFACINIIRMLAAEGEKVVGFDLVPPGPEVEQFLRGLENRVTFVEGDVSDMPALLDLALKHDVRRIVHGAAITPSRAVEQSVPHKIVSVNLMGTVNLLEVARQIHADRFVFVSSSGMYGPPRDRTAPVLEDSSLQLDRFYAICKYSCELLLKRYKSLFGLSTVSGRMAAIYGPMERVTASRGNPSIVYHLVRALKNGKKIRARGVEFVQDVTHVDDACTIWKHLTFGESLRYDEYNVSAGIAYSLGTVLDTLKQLAPEFDYVCVGPGEDVDVEIAPIWERGALDMSRASSEFGFAPRYDLKRGLESYLAWARDYPTLFPPYQ